MKVFILVLAAAGIGFVCGSMIELDKSKTEISKYEQIIETQNEYLLEASRELFETKFEYSLEILKLRLCCDEEK